MLSCLMLSFVEMPQASHLQEQRKLFLFFILVCQLPAGYAGRRMGAQRIFPVGTGNNQE